MIVNAKNTPLSFQSANLPDMSETIMGFFQHMQIGIVQKQVLLNGTIEEIPIFHRTQGVRQPLKNQDLLLKPEGQRAWRWEKMHLLPNIPLKPDDEFVYLGTNYRVMGKKDWKEYGYIEYDVVANYTGPQGLQC